MKLAFLGDRHVSQRSPRYQHALDMWDWAITDALGQGAKAIIGLGDVCEGAMTGEEAYQLADLYTRVTEGGATACEVLGNHEAYDALKWLDFIGVTVADDKFITVPFAHCIVVLTPYARKGRAPYDNLGDGDMTQTNVLAAERLRDFVQRTVANANSLPVIVVGHWAIEGTKVGDSEFEIHASHEMVLPLSALDGVALTIGAHIHEAQELAPNVIVVGSLYRTSFSEAAQEKSYLLVTVEHGQVTWERRAVPCRDMRVETVMWQPSFSQDAVRYEADHLGVYSGKEVKLTVEINESDLATLDASVFNPIKEAAAYFVLDKQVISTQRTRAPQITTATSLPEMLSAWGEATGQDVAGLVAKVGEIER